MCHLGRLKHLVKVARWSFKKVVLFSGRQGGRDWDQEGTHVEDSTACGMFYFLIWMIGSPVFVFTELYAFYMSEILCHTPKKPWALEASRRG